MIMDAYEAYQKFLAIKLHFKQDGYDYFKYHGKTNASHSKFNTRSDKYFFHKLSKKPEVELFLACNLRENTDLWVGDLFDDKAENIFSETQKRLQSLEYMFKLDMQKFDTLNDALVVFNKGKYPAILDMYNKGDIMAETLIILDGVLNLFAYWDQHITDNIIWPRTKAKLQKFGRFMKFDKNKYNDILKSMYN